MQKNIDSCAQCECSNKDVVERYPSQSQEGSIQMVVADARHSLSRRNWGKKSSAVTINNIQWVLCVKNVDGAHIGAAVRPVGTTDTPLSVYAECTLKAVSDVPEYTVSRPFSYDFRIGGEERRFENLLRLADFLDLGKKFTRRNKFVVEARIACCSSRKKISTTELEKFYHELECKVLKNGIANNRVEYFPELQADADCDFFVGPDSNVRRISASKEKLAAASAVFQAMFLETFESSCGVRVTDVDPDVFELMLKHIYGAKWNTSSREQAAALYYVADKYALGELKNRCLQRLWPGAVADVWVALEVSSLYDLERLEEKTMRIVRRNAGQVFRSEKFLSLNRQCVAKILQQNELSGISELDIFQAALRWGEAQCAKQGREISGENLRSVMGGTIQSIRFLAMTPQQFATSPCTSGVLTCEEVNCVFQRLISNDFKLKLPQISCLSHRRRNFKE